MSFTNYMENLILGHIFTHDTVGGFLDYTFDPPEFYLGLWDGSPGELGTGGVEVTGGGYTRIPVPSATWSLPTGGSRYNINVLGFPEATVDWGNVDFFGLCNALSGGDVLIYGELVAAINVVAGMMPRFDTNSVIVNLT